jgi:ribonuclease D
VAHASYHGRRRLPVGVHSGLMSTILVVEDDARTREEMTETLGRLFPRTRVIATAVDVQPGVVGNDAAPIVLADVAVLERVRRWAPANTRVVALTREMGPATLLRAEALGVDASLRAPTRAEHLQAVLGPILDGVRAETVPPTRRALRMNVIGAEERGDGSRGASRHPRGGARAAAPSTRAPRAGTPPDEGLSGTGPIATTESRWVETDAALAEVSQRLRAPGEIALDTEGDSLHHYPERLSLIQLAVSSGDVWLVDPLALGDLAPLAPVFTAPSVQTVLHAGDNDLVQLKRRGFGFAAIFDTSIAARFLGAKALGLDVLLETYLGVELPPSKQRDDWSRRPLSEAQRRYAVADVLHLFALKHRLTEELVRVGRLAWVEEECAALAAQPAVERVPDPNAFAGLKGARDLAPRNLAVLRELYELREALARTLDRPPFKVLGEETLVRLAQAPPAEVAGLEGIPGCTSNVIARWGESILSAVARAGALPEAALPTLERHPRPRIPAVVARRIEALREWRK